MTEHSPGADHSAQLGQASVPQVVISSLGPLQSAFVSPFLHHRLRVLSPPPHVALQGLGSLQSDQNGQAFLLHFSVISRFPSQSSPPMQALVFDFSPPPHDFEHSPKLPYSDHCPHGPRLQSALIVLSPSQSSPFSQDLFLDFIPSPQEDEQGDQSEYSDHFGQGTWLQELVSIDFPSQSSPPSQDR